jgi:hypothetical protein
MISEVSESPTFHAEWPEGCKPFVTPLTKRIVVLAAGLFALHFSAPMGLLLASYLTLNRITAWIIHPAASPFSLFYYPDSQLRQLRVTLHQTFQPISMKTPDGFNLDGILAPGSLKKAVIFIGGRLSPYEVFAQKNIDFIKSQVGDVNVLCFNPRGVALSQGSSSPDLLPYDSYTAIAYLIDKGFSVEEICVVGCSLGGAYGVLGAALIQKQYPEAHLGVVDVYSFSSLTDEIEQTLSSTIGKVISLLLDLFGWSMPVKNAWENLKHPDKTVINHVYDEIVPLPASLYHHAKSGNRILINDCSYPCATYVHTNVQWNYAAKPIQTILQIG